MPQSLFVHLIETESFFSVEAEAEADAGTNPSLGRWRRSAVRAVEQVGPLPSEEPRTGDHSPEELNPKRARWFSPAHRINRPDTEAEVHRQSNSTPVLLTDSSAPCNAIVASL